MRNEEGHLPFHRRRAARGLGPPRPFLLGASDQGRARRADPRRRLLAAPSTLSRASKGGSSKRRRSLPMSRCFRRRGTRGAAGALQEA